MRVTGHSREWAPCSVGFFSICLSLLVLGGGLAPAMAQPARSSPDGLWHAASVNEGVAARMANLAADDGFRPTNFQLFTLARDVLADRLERALQEPNVLGHALLAKSSEISLPMPDGSFQRFHIVESPVMSPALAAKFPDIKAYRGQGIDDPTATMRLDVSAAGVHVQVLSAAGTVIIDPAVGENLYAAFDRQSNRALSRPFECLVQARNDPAAAAAAGRALRSGQHLRTYRLAVACTGEYAARFGGTAAAAMAGIHTTVNRVTGIYEREVAVRLVLVDDNDSLVFTNANTDPFNNGNADVLIDQSQSVIDSLIGNANYDIGHTFSTGAGGLAGLGVVCRTGEKARGVTGRPDPSDDPFDVDYVAHEMGHQFDGDHTFNGVGGNCAGGNRNGPTAVEPGSGSTIQAYAGICNADDLQANSDPYFHSTSLDQIIAYTTTGAGNVPAPVPTGNNIPSVDGGRDAIVPAQTPFRLTATGTDPDHEALLYSWEQHDLGPGAALNKRDDGRIPLFRSFRPSPSPTRTFPQWADILAGSPTPGEQLPVLGREMRFRVTVRDSRGAGGGVSGDDVVVQIVAAAGPFRVTSPASTSVPSNLVNVTWDVANTDQPPVLGRFVNILLSNDGGATFPTTLLSQTANDGAELVALPATTGSGMRIMVEGVEQPFFAVSPVNFIVQPARARIFVVRHAERQEDADPELTEAGRLRARTLSRLLSTGRIHAVYSTDTRRTLQTAEPTATASGVPTTPYVAPASLVDQLTSLEQGEHVLVVGHSDTVGAIVNALGVDETIETLEGFDDLFVVALTTGAPLFQRLKYGPDEQLVAHFARERAAAASPAATDRKQRSEPSDSPVAARRSASIAARPNQVPADRYARSSLPVVFLDQNWSPEEAVEFYGLRQGSPIMRREFFNALEQPDGTDLFRESEYLARFGFLPQRRHAGNPDGYPVGFTGDAALEVACAACHTSRITFAGKEYRIDGSQAMTDFDTWLSELVRALKLTLADAPELDDLDPAARMELDQNARFGRFAVRVLQTQVPRVSQVYIVKQLLTEEYTRRQRYNDYNDFGRLPQSDGDRETTPKHEPYGYGRLDALGAILNQACAEALNLEANASVANAPVNYPAIWDAPQHTHVQWNGAVDNTALFGPLGRNTGQVIGVFGLVDPGGDTLVGYDSSVRFDAVERAEELVTTLWSPLWPEEFGTDPAKVAAGRAVYQRACVGCHAIMKRDDADREAGDILVPISQPLGPYAPLATDPLTARNWNDRQAQVGLLAGRYETTPLGTTFPTNPNARVPSRDVLSHIVFRVIVRSYVPWRDELTQDDGRRRAVMLATVDPTSELMRYKSRPLNGIWSTAPYLHNGSVLNMVELLKAPGHRKTTFRVGSTEYDPHGMGFVDDGPFEFDTTKPGNGNAGHAYGVDLSPEDKAALLEFLKTL